MNHAIHRSARTTAGELPRTLSALPLVALALATPLAPLSTADAQQAGPLEEILVTARFREERLQEAPLAITALTAETLSVKGATNVLDVASWAPNTTIDRLGPGWGPTLAANIRGIGLGDFKAVAEPGVPIYIDDVVLARPTGAIMDLLDLERVEILRGPQGTLFGKNAAGGVVRLITRVPDGEPDATLEVTAGNFNRLDMRGAFGGTLIDDTLFARLSFSSKRRDGHVDVLDFTCDMQAQGTPELAGDIPSRTSALGSGAGCKIDEMGDENSQAARLALRWLASDAVEFNLAGDVTSARERGPADTMLDISPNLPLVQAFNNVVAIPNWGVPFDRRFVTGNARTIYSTFDDMLDGVDTPNITTLDHWGVSGSADWGLTDTLSTKLILSYRKLDSMFGRDSDGSPFPINHTLDRFTALQRTAELRLSGLTQLGRYETEWTTGAFYLRSNEYNPNISILYPVVLPQNMLDRVDDTKTDSRAVFLHTNTALTDQLSLTVGGRYTREQKSVIQTRVVRATGELAFPVTPSSQRAVRFTPTVSLQFQWNEDLQTYATYSEGFRGGGFNPRPATAAQVIEFQPEDIQSWEVGVKSDWLDRRLRANLAAFFMRYEEMQLPSVYVGDDGSVTFPPRNAGRASVPGVELDLTAFPTDAFSVDASVGWNGFEYRDLGAAAPEAVEEAGGSAASAPCIDCRPLRTPEWTASFGAQYRLPGDLFNGRFTVRGDLAYNSRVDFAVNNFDRAAQGGYAVVNSRVTWNSLDDAWAISVSGTNLTDKEYLHSVLDFGDSLGGVQGSISRPREWAVTVRRSF